MQNSSAFCRTQQALQESRAAESALANVSSVAIRAAAAWGAEALVAERWEDRQSKRQLEIRLVPGDAADALLNENPDRGLADPA